MAKKGRVVRVPDIPHPTLCWKQQTDPTKPRILARCTLPKGHRGRHIWERKED